MLKILCKFFGHKFDRQTYWSDKLKVNMPDYKCIRCGVPSEWARKEREHFRTHTCDVCGAWVCTSGICSFCNP